MNSRLFICVWVVVSCSKVFAAKLPHAWDVCFEQAQEKHAVSANLLRAIATVESGGRPDAINSSHLGKTRSIDIGLMQINSANLEWLKHQGVKEQDLHDACISIHVGAQILRTLAARFDGSWEAVGAYNAACTQLKGQACRTARDTYIRKVQLALARIQSTATTPTPPASKPRRLTSVELEDPEPQGNHTLPQAFSPKTQDTPLHSAPET